MGVSFDGTYEPAGGGRSVPILGAGRFEVGDAGVTVSAQAKVSIASWFVGAVALGAFAAAVLYSDDGPPYPSWPKAAVLALASLVWLGLAVTTRARGALKPVSFTVPWANVGALGPATGSAKPGVELALSAYKPSQKLPVELASNGALFFAPSGDLDAVLRAAASARPARATT